MPYHTVEKVILLEGIIAFTQEIGVVIPPHKAHMWNRTDEIGCVAQKPFLHQMRPELPGLLERFHNFYGLADVDGTVFGFGRVIQFTEGRVARTGVVPGIGAFGSSAVEPFINADSKVGLEFFEHHAEGRAHDACANQDNVGAFFGCTFMFCHVESGAYCFLSYKIGGSVVPKPTNNYATAKLINLASN